MAKAKAEATQLFREFLDWRYEDKDYAKYATKYLEEGEWVGDLEYHYENFCQNLERAELEAEEPSSQGTEE